MPQISYGIPPNPPNLVGMNPGNAAPGLVVWLFLLTHPAFLAQIDAAKDDLDNLQLADSNNATITLAEIAEKTHLTAQTVKAILTESYLLPDASANERARKQAAFQTVASQFQNFASTVVDNWDEGNCPGIEGLTGLALNGANINV